MNITCSPFNSPREMVLRLLYLLPLPFLLLAFFLPLTALINGNWIFAFGALLSLSTSCYLRHLGVRHWEFLRLDDEFDKITRQPAYAFETRDENDEELEFILSQIETENWDGKTGSRPLSLLEASCGHREKKEGSNYWDN